MTIEQLALPSAILVSPTAKPSPEHIVFHCSASDTLRPFRYTPLALIFRLQPDANKLQTIGNLVAGLARTLTDIPFWAGSLHTIGGDHRRYLITKPNDAVEFKIRDYSDGIGKAGGRLGSIDDLERNGFRIGVEDPEVCGLIMGSHPLPTEDGEPALLPQASFIDGGLVLYIAMHHGVGDGTSSNLLMQRWAQYTDAASRGVELKLPPYPWECFDRSLIFGRDRRLAKCAPNGANGTANGVHGTANGINGTANGVNGAANGTNGTAHDLNGTANRANATANGNGHIDDDDDEEDVVPSKAVFAFEASPERAKGVTQSVAYAIYTADSIGKLKKLASPRDGSGWISTNDAICAHVWRHFSMGRKLGEREWPQTKLHFAVNIRRFLEPKLNADYLGNAIVGATVKQSSKDIVAKDVEDGDGLRASAKLIRTAVNGISDRNIRHHLNKVEMDPEVGLFIEEADNNLGPDIMYTSWGDFTVYKHGWGAQLGDVLRLRPVSPMGDGLVGVGPAHKDGSREIFFLMDKKVINALEQDAGFTKFATVIGTK